MKKYKVEINSYENIQVLLQELYDEVCRNINEINTHINKINNATNLADESIEMKAKFAKSINDFIQSKDKAIAKKIDIAKLLTEIAKKNGDIQGAIEGFAEAKKTEVFDWHKMMDKLDKSSEQEEKKNENVEVYKL